MTDIECKILGFEERISTKGTRFWRIETDKGFFNCFDMKVIDELKEYVDGEYVDGMCTLIIQEKGNFKHISGISGASPNIAAKPMQDSKYTTMYVSYCKDLIVAGKTPAEAIDIVQQLKNQFS